MASEQSGQALAQIEVGKLALARYDAVVIGAGIGGLVAAALLAGLAGRRVLLLEQHCVAGGLLHEFRRPGGWAFSMAGPLAGGLASGMRARALLDALTGGRVTWSAVHEPWQRFSLPGQAAIDSVSDSVRALEALAETFPGSRAALIRFGRDLERAHASVVARAASRALPGPRLLATVARWSAARGAGLAGRVLAQYLAARFKDEKLRALLTAWATGIGLVPELASFASFATWLHHLRGGALHPEGGMPALIDALTSTIRGARGAVSTGQRVVEISAEQGRVTGVRAVDGRGQQLKVEAPVVISCVGAERTYTQLVPDRWRDYGTRLRSSLPSEAPSFTMLYFGLSRLPEGARGHGQRWVMAGEDFGDAIGSADCTLEFPQCDQAEPRFPVARVMLAWSSERRDRPASREAAHAEFDVALQAAVSVVLEGHFSDFSDCVQHCEIQHSPGGEAFAVASPLALAGVGQFAALQHDPCLGLRSPLRGLYLGGSDVYGVGLTAAAFGGAWAAAIADGPATMWRLYNLK